jgi:hypothetical protein
LKRQGLQGDIRQHEIWLDAIKKADMMIVDLEVPRSMRGGGTIAIDKSIHAAG